MAPGFNPKHDIYAFLIYIIEIDTIFVIGMERNENKEERGRDWPVYKKPNVRPSLKIERS